MNGKAITQIDFEILIGFLRIDMIRDPDIYFWIFFSRKIGIIILKCDFKNNLSSLCILVQQCGTISFLRWKKQTQKAGKKTARFRRKSVKYIVTEGLFTKNVNNFPKLLILSTPYVHTTDVFVQLNLNFMRFFFKVIVLNLKTNWQEDLELKFGQLH